MKTVRNVLVLSMVGICLIACSSDETETESINYKISAPTVNGKRLVKIKYGDEFTSIEYNSQGQVSKVKFHFKNGTSREDSYWYEDRRVIRSPYEFIYYLSDGYAVECKYTAQISDQSTITVECQDTYSYDSKGYLVEAMMAPYDFSEEGPFNEIYTYTWRDGNISHVIVTESSENKILEEYDIKYTSIENSIPLFFTYYYSNNEYLEWQGCFGKRSKNLPQSVTFINRTWVPSWDSNSHTYNYNYTFENGLITKISVESPTIKHMDIYELEWW